MRSVCSWDVTTWVIFPKGWIIVVGSVFVAEREKVTAPRKLSGAGAPLKSTGAGCYMGNILSSSSLEGRRPYSQIWNASAWRIACALSAPYLRSSTARTEALGKAVLLWLSHSRRAAASTG